MNSGQRDIPQLLEAALMAHYISRGSWPHRIPTHLIPASKQRAWPIKSQRRSSFISSLQEGPLQHTVGEPIQGTKR